MDQFSCLIAKSSGHHSWTKRQYVLKEINTWQGFQRTFWPPGRNVLLHFWQLIRFPLSNISPSLLLFHLLSAVIIYKFSFDMKHSLNTWCDSKSHVKNTKKSQNGIWARRAFSTLALIQEWGRVRACYCHLEGISHCFLPFDPGQSFLSEMEPENPLNWIHRQAVCYLLVFTRSGLV